MLPLAARRRADLAVLARRSRARLRRRRVRRRRPAGARRGRRARVPRAVAGHDARAVEGPRALPRDVLVALARRVVARRLGLDRRRRASGSCTAAPTTRSSSRASGSVRPRWRRCSSSTPRSSRRPRSALPDEVKGESLCVFVVLAPGRRADDGAARRAARVRGRRGSGKSFTPGRGPVHDAAAEDAQRQGHAPRDPCGRARRRARATCPGSRIRPRSDAIAASADEGPSRRPVPRGAARAAAAAAQPTTSTRGARCACAAASGSSVGAAARAGQPRSRADRDAFRARCGAWDRQRHFDAAYGFGLFLATATGSPAR